MKSLLDTVCEVKHCIERQSWDELRGTIDAMADGIASALKEKNGKMDPADRRKWAGALLGLSRQVLGMTQHRQSATMTAEQYFEHKED